MEEALKARSLELLQSRHLMTLATVRQDGYRQATLLNYIADDFTPYFAADASSQKVAIASRAEDSSGTCTAVQRGTLHAA